MIADLLARDVAPWGGLESPLLCWLGSLGLMLFFAWHLGRLYVGTSKARAPLVRIRDLLAPLAGEVEADDLRQAYDRACADGRETERRVLRPGTRRTDIERLRAVDEAMRETEALRRPWVQFRKTLLIEHVAWVSEPRVFSTRRADEVFTAEAVLAPSIDLELSRQVPSLITGVGLLFTFVAICLGLGRLHAEGDAIVGIQGLINGLAGKFLTSIVALVCANLFVLLERPAVRRLEALHAEVVALVDESFPRRTVEDLLDALGHAHRSPRRSGDAGVQEQLGLVLGELTSVVRALSDAASSGPPVAPAPPPALADRPAVRHRAARRG